MSIKSNVSRPIDAVVVLSSGNITWGQVSPSGAPLWDNPSFEGGTHALYYPWRILNYVFWKVSPI